MVYLKLETFHLERFQSKWEHIVNYNLAESGVQPFKLEELLGDREKIEIMNRFLGLSRQMVVIPSGQISPNSTRMLVKKTFS